MSNPLGQSAPERLSHLSEGTPGCYALFRDGALTDREIAELPPQCKAFRKDYFDSVDLVKKNPKQYEKLLVQALTQAKRSKTPYEAIFFAKLIHSDALKGALQKRAETEKKLKVPFVYAEVALYSLSGKSCDQNPQFAFRDFYKELCLAQDTILPTFFYAPKKGKK